MPLASGEQRWLYVASAAWSLGLFAAGGDRGTFFTDREILQDLLLMHRMDQRADDRLWIERMSDLDALGFLGHDPRERIVMEASTRSRDDEVQRSPLSE